MRNAYKTGNDVITITVRCATAALTLCQWQGVKDSYINKACAQMLHSLLKKERRWLTLRKSSEEKLQGVIEATTT